MPSFMFLYVSTVNGGQKGGHMARQTGRKSGKHPEKALSAQFVRTLSEPGKYFDGHGLFLRVERSGSKRWVQRINIRGKRTEIGLGSASLVSLAEAREKALETRKVARRGEGPSGRQAGL